MLKIVGYRENKGSFKPEGENREVSYSNYDFSFITDENPVYNGLATIWNGLKTITMPSAKFTEITGLENPAELVGKEIKPMYVPRFGRTVLTSIEIVK